jgi:hypothetical protein
VILVLKIADRNVCVQILANASQILTVLFYNGNMMTFELGKKVTGMTK